MGEGGAEVIDWRAGEGWLWCCSLLLLLWQGQGLFQTVGTGWGGKGVPSPQKWSENGVDEYKQTEIEEQKYRNIVLSGAFLLLSKGIPPPIFLDVVLPGSPG